MKSVGTLADKQGHGTKKYQLLMYRVVTVCSECDEMKSRGPVECRTQNHIMLDPFLLFHVHVEVLPSYHEQRDPACERDAGAAPTVV